MTDSLLPLRDHLVRALDWEEAHAGLDKAIDGIPPERRGDRAAGFAHSPWELLEHMRFAQNDLLDFCVNPAYKHSRKWPDDYWPRDPTPTETAWTASIAALKADRARLQQLARNTSLDLFALVPTGKGQQTYLRALLLVIDHNAYHVGQLIAVRRALGIWKSS
jgi:uncharacterized damage-inducible protein DinB